MTHSSIILIVEDDPVDVRFIRRALSQVDENLTVETARDGQAAIEYLAGGKLPQLILTDLNMPRMNGYDLLKTLKNAPLWKSIPTIIFSTSSDVNDIKYCYSEHANAYLVKPDSMAAYSQIANLLKKFWFEQIELPDFQTFQ
jgi:CheY-like chemotaxis protein